MGVFSRFRRRKSDAAEESAATAAAEAAAEGTPGTDEAVAPEAAVSVVIALGKRPVTWFSPKCI